MKEVEIKSKRKIKVLNVLGTLTSCSYVSTMLGLEHDAFPICALLRHNIKYKVRIKLTQYNGPVNFTYA